MKKFILFLTAAALSSCSGDVKSNLGLRKDAPDEFTVISYPPLSVPPELNINGGYIDERAIPRNVASTSYTSEENKLLSMLSISRQPTDVGRIIDEEASSNAENMEEVGIVRRAFKSARSDSKHDPMIDPEREKNRIDNNIANSKPLNDGNIAVSQPASKSTLSKLFGN